MKLGLCFLLILSGCCKYAGNESHRIAVDNNGCESYQIGCDQIFYTRCPGAPSTSNTDCHFEQQGKQQVNVCKTYTIIQGPQ
jgi:hypothetical protein